MKKIIVAIGFGLGVVLSGLSSVHAVPYKFNGPPTILVASVTVSGTVAATINSAIIRDYNSGGSNPAQILTWPDVNINTGWQRSAQMIMLIYNVTVDNGGIEIFTDNTKGAGTISDPKFVDPTPAVSTNTDSGAGGLLKMGEPTTHRTLPLAWKVAAATMPVTPGDPNVAFDWFYVGDSTNTLGIDWNNDGQIGGSGHQEELGMTHGGFYSSPVFGRGVQMYQAQPVTEDPDSQAYIYLAINTNKASANNTYYTSKLILQAYFN